MCVVSALGAIARPTLPLTGLRLWMGRLLGGLFSHAGGTDALRKARQRSRTMGGPMGPTLTAASGPMGHERHEGPEVPAVTIHHPCVLSGARKVRFRTRHVSVAALLADRHYCFVLPL